jgi:hypothetical protein
MIVMMFNAAGFSFYKDLAGVSVVENPETANAPDPGRQSVCQHQPGPFDVSFAAQSATAECE